MPIYEYECQGCGLTVEAIQKFSDPPLTHCEACGGPLTKLISRTSFQLKGSGWYATDYKKPGAAPAKEPEKKDSSAPAPPSPETKKPCGGGSSGSGSP